MMSCCSRQWYNFLLIDVSCDSVRFGRKVLCFGHKMGKWAGLWLDARYSEGDFFGRGVRIGWQVPLLMDPEM